VPTIATPQVRAGSRSLRGPALVVSRGAQDAIRTHDDEAAAGVAPGARCRARCPVSRVARKAGGLARHRWSGATVARSSEAALRRPDEQCHGAHHAQHRQGDPDPCLANGATDRCGLVDQFCVRIPFQGPAGVGHRVAAAPRPPGVPGFAAAVAATGHAGNRDPCLTACTGTDLPGAPYVTHRPDRHRPEDRHTEQHGDHDQDHRSAPIQAGRIEVVPSYPMVTRWSRGGHEVVTVAAPAGRAVRRSPRRRRAPRRAGVRRAGRTPRGGR